MTEHCRLCAAVLEVSVNNPRRVCAACGEINLPDAAVVASLTSPRIRPWKREPWQVLIGAAAPLLSTVVIIGVTLIGGHLDSALNVWWLPPLAVLISFGAGVWQMARSGTRLLWAAFFWIAGLASGTLLSGALIWLATMLPWLLRRS